MSHVTQPDDPVNLSSSFDDFGDIVISLGLTKREYFAAMAMQGMLSRYICTDASCEEFALWAVEAADQLIARLNK